MPTLDVDLCVIGEMHNESDTVQRVNVPMTKNDWIKIHQNEVRKMIYFCPITFNKSMFWFFSFIQEYTIQANFHRYVQRSSKPRQKTDSIIPKVHCPKFSKIKDEGWFLILGDPSKAELLALKRCSYRNSKSIHSVTFTAPTKIGKIILSLN